MQRACVILYCHLWPVRLYHIFPHYLINRTIFGEKNLINIKCVLIFSTTYVWSISRFEKYSARYCRRCAQVLMWSTRCSCRLLIKLEFSRHIKKKSSNISVHQNPSSGRRVISARRTDMMNLIVAFRNFSNASKNSKYWDAGSSLVTFVTLKQSVLTAQFCAVRNEGSFLK